MAKSAMDDTYSGSMKSGLHADPLSGLQKKAIATSFNTQGSLCQGLKTKRLLVD